MTQPSIIYLTYIRMIEAARLCLMLVLWTPPVDSSCTSEFLAQNPFKANTVLLIMQYNPNKYLGSIHWMLQSINP